MTDLRTIETQCRAELLTIGIVPGTVRTMKYKTMLRTWATTRSDRERGKTVYTIKVSRALTRLPEAALRTIVMHELLHTLPRCFSHGRYWTEKVRIVNAKLGYQIQPGNTKKELKRLAI